MHPGVGWYGRIRFAQDPGGLRAWEYNLSYSGLQVLMRKTLSFGLAVALTALAQISRPAKTGPVVGEVVPAFSATDQTGRTQTLASVMGTKGAMLVFFRSADW
jgi:hypothetical protein